MEYVSIVVMLALLQYIYFSIEVGRARSRFDVPVPATSGNELFERYFRVQQNTGEQLLLFLPGIYACGFYASEVLATLLGLTFVLGRMLYFRGYTDPAKSRSLGFALGLLANVVMILAALFGLAVALLS
jgi:glutathione S-transferase